MTADQQPHPFDPDAPKRIAHFLEVWASHGGSSMIQTVYDTRARRSFPALTVADLQQLLERDQYAERTRLELAEKCADYRGERDEAQEIINRVRWQMEAYTKHGPASVDVSHVLGLLSPTWPDGNYIENSHIECPGTGREPVDLESAPEA